MAATEANFTSILEENTSEVGKNYWAIIVGVVCIIVVIGNVLVIVSVYKEKVLQNITNYFIVSLAVADLLVAGFVMPFSVYVLVNWGLWDMPKIVCDFYIASDVICSTSSIFNLVAISIDRYYAVTSPITYSQHKDKTARAYITIVLCWLLSIGIGSPIMLGANPLPSDTEEALSSNFSAAENESIQLVNSSLSNETSGNYTDDESFVCAFYNPDFIIYSSLGSFYIPCVIMIFLYIRIFATLRARARTRKPRPTSLRANKRSQKEAKKAATMAMKLNNGDISIHNNQPDGEETSKALTNNVTTENEDDKNDEPLLKATTASDQPTPPSPPPSNPNKVHKASGPDTSIFERSKKCRKNQNVASTIKEPQTSEEDPSPTSAVVGESKSNQLEMRSVVTATAKGGKTQTKLILPEQPRRQNPGSALNLEAGGSDLDGGLSTKKKIMSFMSLSGFRTRTRSSSKKVATKNTVSPPLKLRKEKPSARKERKATQTLAIVLAVFLFCWVPFFTCNMLNAICIKFNLGWYPGDTAFIFTTWLGYINSCINPLIYTIFNPEFRKAFKKLLNIS